MRRLKAKQQTDTLALRQALAALEDTPVFKHADAIETLRRRIPHEITIIDVAHNYTCAEFALGISGDPIARELRTMWGMTLTHDFWSWMIDLRLSLVDKSADGQLILYFDEDRWTHVGRIVDTRVLSKWGTFPIYSHPVEQVPGIYGNRIVFAEMPAREEAFDLLLEYAAECRNVPADQLRAYRRLRYGERPSKPSHVDLLAPSGRAEQREGQHRQRAS